MESNQRIKKYADYAARMKLKFGDYETQSEQYYSQMLDKFKSQARKMVDKKQKELDALVKTKDESEARMLRLKERIQERKIKNFWSDESEESEEEPAMDFFTREVDIEEYNYVKAQRRRAKLEITNWVKRFRNEHDGLNPTDMNTQEIALELADFNHVNSQFLEVKMAMIKQDKMPFNAEDFYKETRAQISRAGTRAGSTKFAKQTDKFLATLSQGFGAAANAGNADRNTGNKSFGGHNESILSGTGTGAGKPINYYELRCNELQDEIDELHRLINEGHGHDSVVASYIEQVKRKDRLMLERDQKLDELQTKN